MRIFVADDHSLFRDGIISLLEADGQKVIGQAGDGQTAVDKACALKPDLILMDINMPKLNGLEALREIKSCMPTVKVVMLTVSEDDTNLIGAIQAGADGYLLKHLIARDFLDFVRGLERGEAAITRSMTMRIFKHLGESNKRENSGKNPLTDREVEILRLVANGKSNNIIAVELMLSENTIKYHLKSILQKLGVSNRTEAVMIAMQRKLL